MNEALEKLGLHLTVMLFSRGADDQAYAEIIESLERARERAKNAPPPDPTELEKARQLAEEAGRITITGGTEEG